jgi:hypothetical protein
MLKDLNGADKIGLFFECESGASAKTEKHIVLHNKNTATLVLIFIIETSQKSNCTIDYSFQIPHGALFLIYITVALLPLSDQSDKEY